MPSVGEILRRERLKQGLDLAQVAAQTRIRERFLEALEADDFASLPGKFFARSFAHQYGAKLGLDQNELQSAVDRQLGVVELEMPGPSPVEPYNIPPMNEMDSGGRGDLKWTLSVAVLLIVLGGCSVIYWIYQRDQTQVANAESRADVAAVNHAPVPARMAPAPTVASTPRPTPEPAPVTATAPAPAAVAPPAPPSGPLGEGPLEIEVSAREDAWVQISADGKVVAARVLKAGESRTVLARESLLVKCGNAGGIDVKWKGASIGQVGPRGQIRTVVFSPDKFTILAPKKVDDETDETFY